MVRFDSETGLSADETSAIREGIVNDWTAVFSDEVATLNTESESPAGQIIDSMAVLVTAKDTEFLNLANQFNPLVADGRFQEAIGKIYFLNRKVAESTVVTCQCSGLMGTVIPAGSIIQNTEGYKLESIETATIPAFGVVDVEFKVQESGAIPIGANTCTKIITVIPHWDTVNNASAGTVGRVKETRGEFEERRYKSVAANAHGSVVALYGAIAGLPGVLDCLILENRKDEPTTIQGINLIGHSVAIVVYGGADVDIAEAIYNKLDAGCGTNGDNQVTFISDDGSYNTYNIVRPTPTPVHIAVEINETTLTPATITQDIKDAIYNDFIGADVNSGNTRVGAAQTIYASRFSVATIKTAGVTDLISINIGWSANPTGTVITADANIEPTISKDNITVTINPMP